MKRKPIEERFFSRVNKTKTCWLWTGPTMKQGYGVIGKGGRNGLQFSTHRFSYMHHFGEIPEGMNVLHKCDVRNCVNPSHLFLGTIQDNMKDMATKGKRKGVKHHMSKLTEKQVINIRKEYSKGDISLKKIAIKYDMCAQSIHDIILRKNWTHI